MASSFFNPKNQHLKNLVPVTTKKEQTDALPDDYIDLSWLDVQNELNYERTQLVTTDTLHALEDKMTDGLANFEEKAGEIVKKAIEHHAADVARFKETVSGIYEKIDGVEAGIEGKTDALQSLIEGETEARINADKEINDKLSKINTQLEVIEGIEDATLIKTINVPVTTPGKVDVTLPKNTHIESVTSQNINIYPEITVDEDGTVHLNMYDASNAPEGFEHYTEITITYSCTFADNR